jgi:hypothetical protein
MEREERSSGADARRGRRRERGSQEGRRENRRVELETEKDETTGETTGASNVRGQKKTTGAYGADDSRARRA